MTEKHHKLYKWTVDEWIAAVPNELSRDAIGLWHIVSTGRNGFGLSGAELVDYVRRNLLALFANGAKPVIGGIDKEYLWGRVGKYGDDPQQMADAIIDEWLTSGHDPDAGDVWFATPNVYGERRRGSRG
jgi:hypothetical protein